MKFLKIYPIHGIWSFFLHRLFIIINPSYQWRVERKVGASTPVEVLALVGEDVGNVDDLHVRDVLQGDKFKMEQVCVRKIHPLLDFIL